MRNEINALSSCSMSRKKKQVQREGQEIRAIKRWGQEDNKENVGN